MRAAIIFWPPINNVKVHVQLEIESIIMKRKMLIWICVLGYGSERPPSSYDSYPRESKSDLLYYCAEDPGILTSSL